MNGEAYKYKFRTVKAVPIEHQPVENSFGVEYKFKLKNKTKKTLPE